MKDLLSMSDLSINELDGLIKFIEEIKECPGKYSNDLGGKILVMIFEKPSTRTRVSFESAMLQLGGHAVNINRDTTQMDRGETIADSARVISRYVDGIMARVNKHATLVELAENSCVPIVNGLSDLEHPCQIISDLFTIYKIKGRLKGINIAYVGDGNNVCHSLILGCAMTGTNLIVASPEGYKPHVGIMNSAYKLSKETGSCIEVMDEPTDAVVDADFIYTDVWISMGYENEMRERIDAFRGYQINDELLSNARKNTRVMHCLPAHRGMEITSSVLNGPMSIVWDQAENRLHSQKAILIKLLSRCAGQDSDNN